MSPVKMSELEKSIRLVMEFNEALNHHDAAGMMALMTEDCVFENTFPAPDGTRHEGKEAVGKFWEEFLHNSADAHIEIEEIFGIGLRCVMRWRYSWGEGHIRGVDVYQIRDGLIYEKLSYVKG